MVGWLEELDRLTARDGEAPLHDHVIGVAARRLGASGGALWRETSDDRLEVIAQLGLGNEPIDRMHDSWSGHESILRQVLESGRPQTVTGRLDQSSAEGEQSVPSSTPLHLIVAPFFAADKTPDGVIELFVTGSQDESAAATSAEALHEFLSARHGRSNTSQPVFAGLAA